METSRGRLTRRQAVRGVGAIGAGSLLVTVHPRALAQDTDDATPGANGAACVVDPGVGDTVSLVGPEGTELATMSARAVQDPFDGYNSNYAPAAGYRYVAIDLAVTITGSRPVSVRAYDFFVQDAEGFIYRQANVQLLDDATEALFVDGEFTTDTGSEGLVSFAVLRGAQVTRLFYQPSGDRLILVADLRG